MGTFIARKGQEEVVLAESDADMDAELSDEERATVAMFDRCRESVVHINTNQDVLVRRGMSLSYAEVPKGSGTGFAWDDHHVVTNYHVIMESTSATVTLCDHSTFEAKIVGVEPDCDLAVLRIDRRSPLRPLKVGRSSRLRVGQRVYAIGNPFGLDNTLTGGLVSGLGREMEGVSGRKIRGLVQTDAAINPGNSGGPLLNQVGQLIGVNTMITSPSGAFSGVSFAIPVDTVSRVVKQLIQFGRTQRPWLGVHPVQHPRARNVREQGGVCGVLILHVEPGSPAAKAGLRGTVRDRRGGIELGDEVIAVEGQRVSNPEELVEAIESQKIGATVKLTVRGADGRVSTAEATLEVRPDNRQLERRGGPRGVLVDAEEPRARL